MGIQKRKRLMRNLSPIGAWAFALGKRDLAAAVRAFFLGDIFRFGRMYEHFGNGVYPGEDGSLRELFERADERMYENKKRLKNWARLPDCNVPRKRIPQTD